MAQGKRGAAEKNVLAVDVGNTRTRLGLFANGGLLGTCELTTCERLTVDEARMKLAQAAVLMGEGLPDEAILACVVPTLTDVWRRALAAACGCRPLVVGPGLKTGPTSWRRVPSMGRLRSWWTWERRRTSRSWMRMGPSRAASSPRVLPWAPARSPRRRPACP